LHAAYTHRGRREESRRGTQECVRHICVLVVLTALAGAEFTKNEMARLQLIEMAQSGPGKKVANSLVALSSAAVLAVYAAGYTRTRSAASRLEAQSEERRPAISGPPRTAPLIAESLPIAARAPAPVAVREAPRKPVTIAKAEVPAPVETPEPPPVEQKAELPPPAPVVPVMPPAPPAPPAPVWKDGTYTGWGTSRHGDIEASVVIEGGRIVSATISQCLTRYSCSVIDKLPPQVAQRQSPETDYVSGATQSTNAFYYGVVQALSKAK
jgi:uncharacterized protein with FMN-binding domain